MKFTNSLLIIVFFLCYLLSFEIVYSQDTAKTKKTESPQTNPKEKKTDTLQVNQKAKKINDTLYVLVDKAEKKEDVKTLAETLISNNNIALAIMVGIQLLITAGIGYYFNRETEKYKSELDTLKNKVQIQFTKLYAEQSEVIKQIYNQIYDFKLPLEFIIDKPEQKIKEIGEEKYVECIHDYQNKFAKAFDYYNNNKILLTEDLSKQIENLFKLLAESNREVKKQQNPNKEFYIHITPDKQEVSRLSKLWENQKAKIDTQMNDALNLLESEFRKILGVQNIDNQ